MPLPALPYRCGAWATSLTGRTPITAVDPGHIWHALEWCLSYYFGFVNKLQSLSLHLRRDPFSLIKRTSKARIPTSNQIQCVHSFGLSSIGIPMWEWSKLLEVYKESSRHFYSRQQVTFARDDHVLGNLHLPHQLSSTSSFNTCNILLVKLYTSNQCQHKISFVVEIDIII